MSKRNKPKTPEERRLLAHSQMAEASATLLRATSRLATTLRFESVGLTCEFPIASTRLTDGCITIEFLYGPPEFHVEMFLSHNRHPDLRLSLAELIRHRPIRAWMNSHCLQPPGGIESEVSCFGELLLRPCAEAFTAPHSFFKRFPCDDRNA
jgi:hypothetical protein